MAGQTVILCGPTQIAFAKRLIDLAPLDAILNIKKKTRSNEQNALMWVLLGEISRAKPQGRKHVPDVWKCLFMQALGHEIEFQHSLVDGSPFPTGFKTSSLTVEQMKDLIEFIYCYGAENGVEFSEQQQEDAA